MTMTSYQVEAFGQPLAQKLREVPQPQGREVIVRIGSCGVCHSDVHLHDGFFDLGAGQRLDMTRALQPPRALGHEIAGTVVAVGPRVVFPWIGCGSCSLCADGREHLCNRPQTLGIQRDGGFSSHVVVPDAKYLVDYGTLAEEQACTYACSGLTAYSALKKVGQIGPQDPLLIIGAGGVGLSGIRLARQMFGVAPIVVELDESKWAVAREAGAGELINPAAEGALKALIKSTGGGVAAAIDFVGADSSFNFGFSALRKAGKLVCVGLFGGATPLTPAMVSMKAVSVEGSYVGSLQEMQELMAIARTGVLPDLPLTTQPLSSVTQALEDLRAGRIRGRTILKAGA
jgi:alcohol dehydrogenase/propanol-preferring alcohol dehydrogenase